MYELIAALGLALFIEGILYAVFPAQMKKLMLFAISQSPSKLRKFGIFVIFVGLCLVALTRIWITAIVLKNLYTISFPKITISEGVKLVEIWI